MGETPDYQEIQALLSSVFDQHPLSFETLVSQLQSGDFSQAGATLFSLVRDWMSRGGLFHLADFAGIVLLVLLFALLRITGQAFENKSAILLAGMIVHLLLIVQLAALFSSFVSLTRTYLQKEIAFCNLLFPVLAVASAVSGNSLLAAGTYACGMAVCSLVSHLCLFLLLPGVSIFLVLTLLDCAAEERLFSGWIALLRRGLEGIMKLSVMAVGGLQLMQLMILPKADSVRQQALLKSVSLIPGVGGMADTAATLFLKSSSLLRGSIGAAGMLCVLGICLFPILRLGVTAFFYRLIAAVIAPAADQKIGRCLDGFAQGLEYLVKITFMGALILLLLIAAAAW